MKLETPQHIKDRIAALTELANKDNMASRAEKAIGMALPFVKKHEGFRPNAYWDSIGKRWTVGHGHTFMTDPATGKTRPVRKGDVMDEATSSSLVEKRLRENAAKLYKDNPWSRYLGPGALAGFYDVAYNAGPGALSAKRSPSLNRQMNAPGADRDAIAWKEIPTYRTSGGKIVRGLVNRRADAAREFGPRPAPVKR